MTTLIERRIARETAAFRYALINICVGVLIAAAGFAFVVLFR